MANINNDKFRLVSLEEESTIAEGKQILAPADINGSRSL